MKKVALLMSLSAATFAAHAQLSLGASPYTQNFNSIGSSLPTGWIVYTGATATSLGTIYAWSGSTNFGVWADTVSGTKGLTDMSSCTYCGSVWGKGFKNSASANGAVSTDTGDVQKGKTDRALAVKQTSTAGYNPGPAFVLHLANTVGLSNFAVSFKLQSLDYTAPATTTWTLDYGIGSSPSTFTPVTATGTMTTGTYTFSNNTITASFGSALNNQTQDVWIRIVTLSPTVNTMGGTGTRTTTGIDDFSLTYTGTPSAVTNYNVAATELSLVALGEASSNSIVLGYATGVHGNYNLSVYSMTGQMLHNETVESVSGLQQKTITGLNLAPGLYFAKLTNGSGSAVARIAIQ